MFQVILVIIILEIASGLALGLYLGYVAWRGPRRPDRVKRVFRASQRRKAAVSVVRPPFQH